jgi:hypothetical protein
MRLSKLIIVFLSLIPAIAFAQGPIQWSFSAEKIKLNQYRVHLVAKIQSGYHIFSMTQPEDAIVLPTKVSFSNNGDIDEIGAFKEEGELEKTKDEVLEIESWQYSNKVNFTGIVTLKSSKSKTILSGEVEFQVCSSDRCYPPTKVNFRLPLNH